MVVERRRSDRSIVIDAVPLQCCAINCGSNRSTQRIDPLLGAVDEGQFIPYNLHSTRLQQNCSEFD